MKINIVQCDLKSVTYFNYEEVSIIYTEKYLRYKLKTEATVKKEDEDWNTEDKRYDFDQVTLKENIRGLNIAYANNHEAYQLEIDMQSLDSIDIFFAKENRSKAYKVYRELFKWWTNDELPEE